YAVYPMEDLEAFLKQFSDLEKISEQEYRTEDYHFRLFGDELVVTVAENAAGIQEWMTQDVVEYDLEGDIRIRSDFTILAEDYQAAIQENLSILDSLIPAQGPEGNPVTPWLVQPVGQAETVELNLDIRADVLQLTKKVIPRAGSELAQWTANFKPHQPDLNLSFFQPGNFIASIANCSLESLHDFDEHILNRDEETMDFWRLMEWS